MKQENLLANIPQTISEEVFQTILLSEHLRIERIISKGQKSEKDFWYDQDQHEWIVVIKGAARLQFQDKTLALKPGDYINIPAHEKHRVDWTTPDEETVWLAIFY
jgi:cupin 2 domain-containing protein